VRGVSSENEGLVCVGGGAPGRARGRGSGSVGGTGSGGGSRGGIAEGLGGSVGCVSGVQVGFGRGGWCEGAIVGRAQGLKFLLFTLCFTSHHMSHKVLPGSSTISIGSVGSRRGGIA